MKYKTIKIKKFYVSILVVLLVFIAQLAVADTEVGGNITEDTIWTKANSPYIVTSTVQVFQGVKLTIEPGVIVKFKQDRSLTIGGELIAQGTEDNMITFTSDDPQEYGWGSIKFTNDAIGARFDNEGNYLSGSIIEYCIIEYGGDGGSIYCRSDPFISHNIIKNNRSGIRNEAIATRIFNNTITSNKGTGIYNQGEDVVIENNVITHNSVAMDFYGYGAGIFNEGNGVVIKNNTISENTAKNAGGIWNSSNNTKITGNIIDGNILTKESVSPAGGILSDGSNIIISNNTITNHTSTSNPYAIYDCWVGASYTSIENNIIDSNSRGIYSRGKISGNTIMNNTSVGIWGCGIMTSNIIENNGHTGIHVGYGDTLIQLNRVVNNGVYAIEVNVPSGASVSIRMNNIYGGPGVEYYVRNHDDNDIDASNNYWGTTDTLLIDDKIYDYYDDIELGKVKYEPVALQPFDFSGGSISGTITDSSTGQPVSDASISSNIGVQITTDASGQYTLEHFSPGDYTLTVTAPLYHSLTVENVTVSAGETTTLNISLDPKTTGTVAGQVVSAEGLTPIENVTVQISNGTYTSSVNSDTNGDFTFSDITYGNYTVDLISDSYRGIPYSVTVNVDEITEMSLVGIPRSIVDDIRNGWYSQAELDQAVADAEAAKDVIIAQKDQMISNLNNTISAMFTQEELDGAVAHAQAAKDEVIAEKDQTISNLNQTIASMYTQQQLYQAVADAEAAKDEIIAQKDQTIAGLNSTIASMYTQEQLNQAVADAAATKDEIIALKDQTISQLNSTIAVMFTQEQLNQAVLNERRRWDINDDNKISLEEAIHALQVVSGIRTQ